MLGKLSWRLGTKLLSYKLKRANTPEGLVTVASSIACEEEVENGGTTCLCS